MKFVIVAPELQVIGSVISKKIILDGKSGVNIVPFKAKDGSTPAIDGEDGKSGYSGGQSGAFYGIFENRSNGKKLRIQANGGRGGNGQNGGNGKDGVKEIGRAHV